MSQKENPLNLPAGASSLNTASYTKNLQHTSTHRIPLTTASGLKLLMEVLPRPASTSYYHFVFYSSLQTFALARAVYTLFLETMALCMPIPWWGSFIPLFYLCKSCSSSNFLFHSKVTFLIITTLCTPMDPFCFASWTDMLERVWALKPNSPCIISHHIKHGL